MLWLATSALVVGCSAGHDAGTTRTPLSVAPRTTESGAGSPSPSTTATTAPRTTPTATAAPSAGAGIADVIAWVEAGKPVAAQQFGSVSRGGVVTAVDGVAFTTDQVSCISTASYRDGALACLVDLDDPAPRPADAIAVWKGNWVDFDGLAVEIGSVRGDPGPFRDGEGAILSAGASLDFGDFRCRADTAAVLCVNYAQRSAVRLAPDGVDGFGCLTEADPAPGIGIRLAC